MNTFTFTDLSAYLTAKGSSGDIYAALSAAGTSPVNACVVSYITATGQTFIDVKNPIVDEPYGEIGDTLLYKGGTYYWLKSRKGYNAGSYGSVFCVESALTGAGYTLIGTLIHREGKTGLIMSKTLKSDGTEDATNGTTTLQWCTANDNFTNMPGSSTNLATVAIRNADGRGPSYRASVGLDYRERVMVDDTSRADKYNQYSYPFPRAQWNAMMDAFLAGSVKSRQGQSSSPGYSEASDATKYTTTPGTTVGWSWKVEMSSNKPQAMFSYSFEGTNRYFDPKKWDYSFDKWYKDCVQAQTPRPPQGMIYSASESECTGRDNTRRILAFASANSKTVPAATACNTHTMTSDGQFSAGKWWMPNMEELLKASLNDRMLSRKGTNVYPAAHWSSTQSSASNAWYCYFTQPYCYTHTNSYKDNNLRVVAVSAYHFL